MYADMQSNGLDLRLFAQAQNRLWQRELLAAGEDANDFASAVVARNLHWRATVLLLDRIPFFEPLFHKSSVSVARGNARIITNGPD